MQVLWSQIVCVTSSKYALYRICTYLRKYFRYFVNLDEINWHQCLWNQKLYDLHKTKASESIEGPVGNDTVSTLLSMRRLVVVLRSMMMMTTLANLRCYLQKYNGGQWLQLSQQSSCFQYKRYQCNWLIIKILHRKCLTVN